MAPQLLGSIVLASLVAGVGCAEPVTPAVYSPDTPGVFYATPRGGRALDAAGLRLPCFGGKLLQAWQVGSGASCGIIYVSSAHSLGQCTLGDAVESIAALFRGVGLRTKRVTGFCALGTPAVRLTVRGPGNGTMLRALNSSYSGSTDTTAHFVVAVRDSLLEGGSDTVVMAMGCPSGKDAALLPRFREVVHGSGVLRGPGLHSVVPRAAAMEGPPSEPAGEGSVRVVIESVPTIEDLLELTSSPGPGAGPWAPAQCSLSDGRVVPVTVLLGALEQTGNQWMVPADDASAVFICVAASADRAWVLPADHFRRLAQPTDDGLLLLAEGSSMAPYSDAWGFLSFLGSQIGGGATEGGE